MLYGMFSEKVLHQNLSPVWEIGLFYLVFVTALLLMFVRKITTGSIVIVLALIALFFSSGSRYYALTAFFLIPSSRPCFYARLFLRRAKNKPFGPLVAGFFSFASPASSLYPREPF